MVIIGGAGPAALSRSTTAAGVEMAVAGRAARTGLIGVTEGEAAALARQVHGIPGVQAVEAFGSRVGGTFRGRPPTPASDLDILVTLDSKVISSPEALRAVHAELGEIGAMWQSAKGFPLQPMVEIDSLMPALRANLKQTPFLPLTPR